MPNILDDELSAFLLEQIPARPPEILAIEEEAKRTNFPIIGPLSGRVLETTARAIGAKRVLELGSGFGYSAYWWSRAIGDGEIVWTDASEDNEKRARALHAKLFPQVKMTFLRGDALASARPLPPGYDVVFVDVDKDGYPDAFELAREKVRKGGAIVFDNVLWSRRVMPAHHKDDAMTKGVLELLRRIREATDLVTTIVPVRDGVSVSIKVT